jgi:hypothetical protein
MSKFLKIKSSPNEYVVSPDEILSISEDVVSGGIKILTKTSSATIASSTIEGFVKESKDKIKDLNAGSQSVFLDVNLEQGGISVEEISGGLESVQAGDNILIDVTDPKNPIITAEGSIEGTNYIFVAADGTDTENALALQAAYDEAKTLSPSATNRITIIAANGYYNFGTDTFVMDTQFIDLVSLDGNRSVIFNHPVNTSDRTEGSISITADNVYVKGVNVLNKNFTIATNLPNIFIENCQGGQGSFGGDLTNGSAPITVNGTFLNCDGINLDPIFGDTPAVTCFGGWGLASGKFTNCTAGNTSFGDDASGLFINCTAGSFGFGGGNTLTGSLYYCRLTSGTFNTVSGGGVTVLCIDGNNQVNTQN